MDEVEALARAYCREMGLDPDQEVFWELDPHTKLPVKSSLFMPPGEWVWFQAAWHAFKAEAESRIRDAAWARAMEAVKR